MSSNSAPLTIADQVREKLIELEAAINAHTPNLPSLLRTIHGQLKKDPEIVTLLSEEECSILVSGLKEHTQIELACKALKSAPRTSLKSTSLADL